MGNARQAIKVERVNGSGEIEILKLLNFSSLSTTWLCVIEEEINEWHVGLISMMKVCV